MKGFLALLLVVSVIFNVFLLMFERKPPVVEPEKEIPREEMKQIHEIATACGIDPSKVGSMSAKEILSDIRGMLLNAEPYYGDTLNEAELGTVRSYLNNKKTILQTIETQNKYLMTFHGKRVLILSTGNK